MTDIPTVATLTRGAVMILDEAAKGGLPDPWQITVAELGGLEVGLGSLDDVIAWAVWIEAAVKTSQDGRHHDAEGEVFDMPVRVWHVDTSAVIETVLAEVASMGAAS